MRRRSLLLLAGLESGGRIDTVVDFVVGFAVGGDELEDEAEGEEEEDLELLREERD